MAVLLLVGGKVSSRCATRRRPSGTLWHDLCLCSSDSVILGSDWNLSDDPVLCQPCHGLHHLEICGTATTIFFHHNHHNDNGLAGVVRSCHSSVPLPSLSTHPISGYSKYNFIDNVSSSGTVDCVSVFAR